jgi:hypothetical protein
LLNVYAFKSFTVADTVSASAGGTFAGNITVTGNLSVDGGTIKLDGNYPTGTANVALGDTALDSNVSGGYNTAIGNLALTSCTSNYHTVVGSFAGQNLTTALSSGAIGAYALNSNTTGPYNYAFGNSALQVNTTGGYNTAIGSSALTANTTASNNTAVGYQSLKVNTTGAQNTAVGRLALDANTTASENTAVGNSALGANTTGANNTGLGSSALVANTTGAANVSVGVEALQANTTASSNTAVGYQAGYSGTTAFNNAYFGIQAGYSSTTGQQNTFIGRNSGYHVTTGSKNTILGCYTGNAGGLDIRTSSNNIVLSDGDGNPRVNVDSTGAVSIGAAVSPYGSTRLYLGNGASGNALFQANNTHNVSGDVLQQSWLGSNCSNTSSYFLLCGVVGVANRMYVYGNGNIVNTNNSYGALSDVKLKENIVDASSQWDDIKALTVRKYSMKEDNLDAPNMLGVIAQEVEDAGMGGLVFESPDRDTDNNVLDTTTKHVSYSILYMKAVKALQEAMERIETLETQNASFEARITALEGA